MAATFCLCLFTAFFLSANDFYAPLHESTARRFWEASLYLRIYFAGVTGLLLYTMGSGVLPRQVGDTKRPPLFPGPPKRPQHHLGSYFRAPVPYGHCRRCLCNHSCPIHFGRGDHGGPYPCTDDIYFVSVLGTSALIGAFLRKFSV